MKKKVLLSSAALLAAVSLAACGNNSNSTSKTDSTTQQGGAAKEKVTLKLAALESGYGAEMWPAIIKAYEEANPNVKVELTQDKEIEDKITPSNESRRLSRYRNACIKERKQVITRNFN